MHIDCHIEYRDHPNNKKNNRTNPMQAPSPLPINRANSNPITQYRSLRHIKHPIPQHPKSHPACLALQPSKNRIESKRQDRRTEKHYVAEGDVLGVVFRCACYCCVGEGLLLVFGDGHVIGVEGGQQLEGDVEVEEVCQGEAAEFGHAWRSYYCYNGGMGVIYLNFQKMNAQQPEVTIKKMILTTKGPIDRPHPETTLILAHEHLHPVPQKTPTKPLTLQSFSFHTLNPLSLQNSSITPSLIDHQIHSQLAALHLQPGQALIVDSSADGGKDRTPDVFGKFGVVRGYGFGVPLGVFGDGLSKETEFLMSRENVGKEIQYTFGLLGDECRGFIGELDLPYHIEMSHKYKHYNQALTNILTSYTDYSTKTSCPIFINLLKHGTPAHSRTPHSTSQLQSSLEFLLPKLTASVYKNILLINPRIQIQFKRDGTILKYENKSQGIIQELYRLGFSVVFDLARYRNEMCLVWIAGYLREWPDQTIIGPGLKFKTDFIQYGGQGLGMENSLKTISQVLGQDYKALISKATKENIIKLLTWYQKKIVKVQIKMWKCVKCGKECPQTEESFRKFNKDFCSIDCLRGYKF